MFHLTYPQLHISVCLDSNLRKWNSMFFFFSVFLNTVISITEWLTLSRTHGGWGQSHRISLRGIGDCFGGYWVTLQSQRLHFCTDADISAALLNALLCLAVLSLCQTVASQETSKVCLCRLYPILIYSLISQKGRSKKKVISNNNTNNQTNKIIINLKLLYIVLKRRTKIPCQSSCLCNVYPYSWWTQQTN